MKQSLRFLLLFLLALSHVHGTELNKEELLQGLQNNPEVFQKIEIKNPGVPFDLNLNLKGETLKIGDAEFDGFRFTAPAGCETMDWVWYFNVPSGWGNWYIAPAKGPMARGFRGWLEADKLYETLDHSSEPGRFRVLQTLAAGYLQPGSDYIIWFRKVEQGSAGDLRARIRFFKNGSWDYGSMETALELRPMPAADQVEHLQSRGGKILLDPSLFEASFGNDQVASIFSQFRQASTMAGLEAYFPPRVLVPSYFMIKEKYGEPDFSMSSAEKKIVWQKGAKLEGDKEEGLITYYYDYVGFEVSSKDPTRKVLRVVTQAGNYADLLPGEDGLSFGRLRLRNLIVFYQDRKETARYYYFMQGDTVPIRFGEPAFGKYIRENESLEYQAKGQWVWTTYFQGNTISQKVPFKAHVMDGKAEGFYEDGKPRFTANYEKGRLEGEVLEYSPKGEVLKRANYLDGRIVK